MKHLLQHTLAALALIPFSLIDSSGRLNIDTSGLSVDLGNIVVDGGATVTTGQGSSTSTAAAIVAAASTRRNVTIQNLGSTNLYMGPSGVTSANGFPIPAGASYTSSSQAAIYGITASGSCAYAFIAEST